MSIRAVSHSIPQGEPPHPARKANNSTSSEQSPAEKVPNEVLRTHIFPCLSMEELGKVSRVSKQWREASSERSLWEGFDLQEVFPDLSIIDKSKWERVIDLDQRGLSTEDASPLNKRNVITRMANFGTKYLEAGQVKWSFRDAVEDSGVTLLTLPKGLDLAKIATIARSAFEDEEDQEFPTSFFLTTSAPIDNPIPIPKPLTETSQVLITDGVLSGSANVNEEDIEEWVTSKGGQVPSLLSAATLITLTRLLEEQTPPNRLYNGENGVKYSYCRTEGTLVVIGDHTTDALDIASVDLFNKTPPVRVVMGRQRIDPPKGRYWEDVGVACEWNLG